MQYHEKQWKQPEIKHKPPPYEAVEDQRKMGKNQHFGQFLIKERIDAICYIRGVYTRPNFGKLKVYGA